MPQHIAERWNKACKGSADEADESGKQVLGKIKIISGGSTQVSGKQHTAYIVIPGTTVACACQGCNMRLSHDSNMHCLGVTYLTLYSGHCSTGSKSDR